jgi:hypothetical protein
VLAAAIASPDPDKFWDKAREVLTPVPAVTEKPAESRSGRPEPAPGVLNSRLSWTTVRPDSPAPSLAEIFAGA